MSEPYRGLNAALARSAAPAGGDPTLTVAQVNALTGDDVETWLTNPFMDPGMLADKVCWWVTAALAAVADDGLAERVRALADEKETRFPTRAAASNPSKWLISVPELRALLSPEPAVERVTGRELHCDDCQQPYGVWFADNAVWNLVMGGPDAKGDPGGMLCPRCFTVRAEVVYQRTAIWRLTLNNAPAPSADRDERDGA